MKASTSDHRHRVLIVDDHAFVRLGLADLINHELDLTVCGAAKDSNEALEILHSVIPDLMLVDLSLEGSSGIELIKDVHARRPNMKVLVLSMHDEEIYAERVLRAGAKGYINKHEPTPKLLAAIRTVIDGKIYLSDVMTKRLLHRAVVPAERQASSSVEELSDRELQVFEHIGEGLNTQQIAERLFLSSKTIETYREHIKTKLKIANGNELVRLAVRWRFEQE